jgi:hypothetical protein
MALQFCFGTADLRSLMPRYYFDLRYGDDLAADEEEMVFATIDGAQSEAAHSLADMARDAVRRLRGGKSQFMAIEVRDDKHIASVHSGTRLLISASAWSQNSKSRPAGRPF